MEQLMHNRSAQAPKIKLSPKYFEIHINFTTVGAIKMNFINVGPAKKNFTIVGQMKLE